MGKTQDVVIRNCGGSKRKYEYKKHPIIVIIQRNVQIIITNKYIVSRICFFTPFYSIRINKFK